MFLPLSPSSVRTDCTVWSVASTKLHGERTGKSGKNASLASCDQELTPFRQPQAVKLQVWTQHKQRR
ncbi:hypothetical protein JOB18_044419 [Solea senegalensis]|uniref:Uncharacterized protein n=1 Tax=Solea senegalensis TaxID=28829 RepID=A0AAV6SWR8_SOLSE|nr:hypothetical protein JOB18_044419 [Solea senegalensis]